MGLFRLKYKLLCTAFPQFKIVSEFLKTTKAIIITTIKTNAINNSNNNFAFRNQLS